MPIREHLLLGSEFHGTLYTGCGRTPEKVRDGYALGPSLCLREVEYVRLRQAECMHMCGRCEAAWRKICRDRGQEWTPTRREREATERVAKRTAKQARRARKET